MSKKRRTYEVSVWTLQDEFISILKASNIENKGQIGKPDFELIDDGTEGFSFSIPMYLHEGKQKIENPLWYDTKNGVLLQDLRKIKVTFNKNTPASKTFEFIITKIQEKHESDELYCDITCEGLAFHELGKVGYKISMTADDFNDEDYQYFIGEIQRQPRATLRYWMDKIMPYLPSRGYIDPAQWYYKIDMDWSSYEGERDRNKVYEDPYVKSWEVIDSKFVPSAIEKTKQKERIPDIKESNIYNITQDLAELFGVFCRYEYKHNENLNIIQRTVVFYNSYTREKEGYIDLTYPFSTSAITRERESTDLSTKMYVRPADDETSPSGQITIMDVAANKLHEDYLLNFDYLLKIGNITEEQVELIQKFETEIGNYNIQLKSIEDPLMALQNKMPDLEAQVTLLTNSIQLDKERISASNDLLNELTDGTGELEVTSDNPKTAVLVKYSIEDDNQTYYISLTDKGILPETVKIYYEYDFTHRALDREVTSGRPEYDEFNNLTRIVGIFKNENMKSTVYLTYKYIPQLCYENVKKVWETKLNKDQAELEKVKSKLETTKNRIEALTEKYQTILDKKNKCQKDFERIMGPAIRESYWQPEDYKDYGNTYIDEFTMTDSKLYNRIGDSTISKCLWDAIVFEDELEQTGYETGINQDLCGYPVIDLSGHETYLKEHYKELSFMFYDFKHESDLNDQTARTPRNMKVFSAGSTAQYGFVAINNVIKPVLIITGFETLADDSRERLSNARYSPTIGVIKTSIDGTTITTSIDPGSWTPTFLNSQGDGAFTPLQLYYPRIEINSLSLKIDDILFGLTYNGQLLTNYEDYYILMRDTSIWDEDELIIGNSAYYVTIKPEVFLAQGGIDKLIKIKFNISNADISIYLDAIKVLEENSQPKVSYTIDPSVVDENFLYTLYNKLCRICNINDTELKFKNVQGYISEVHINCDKQEEDSIEIKNYKTKFEDLFSSIVAQTEAMKKSAYAIDIVSDSFSGGSLSADILQSTISGSDLVYSFNDGSLTIDEKNGIVAASDSGVVAFRGDGIFTASDKDEDGNWRWSTAILPSGINANLITTGQLDTNRIRIYSGDKVRFQLNSDGLFAYKSFFEDLKNYNLTSSQREKVTNSTVRVDDIDSAQYVVMNENGLFLWSKKDALVLNKEKTEYIQLEQDVARVEVSWEGFKLRNWNNEEVFYADPDTGNLHITGAINATSLFIDGNNGNQLSLDSTTGEIILNGSTIKIEGEDVNIQASKDINISGGGSLNLEGSSITMSTTTFNENYQQITIKNMDLSANGIRLNAGNDLVLIIEKDLIHFQAVEYSNSINNSEVIMRDIFSVDKEGTIFCKRIKCEGEITGIIPEDNDYNPNENTYILKYNSEDTLPITITKNRDGNSNSVTVDRTIDLWTPTKIESDTYHIAYNIFFKVLSGTIKPTSIELLHIPDDGSAQQTLVSKTIENSPYYTTGKFFGLVIEEDRTLSKAILKNTQKYKLRLTYTTSSAQTITCLGLGKVNLDGQLIDLTTQLTLIKQQN